jgi:dihydrofolate reductase
MTDGRVVLVAAVATNGVIGLGGDIPWHISEDLKHFRATTTGHAVLMGRRTYEAIGHPLPYRTNIVLTRARAWSAGGILVVHDVPTGIERGRELDDDVMVIGGGAVYAEAMPLATHQVITEVHQSPEGDTYYPDFDPTEWRETSREPHEGYDFVWWERVPAQASLKP